MKKMFIALKKKSASITNNKAFTLIDTLFAFSIFCLIIFMISPVFQLMLTNKGTKSRLQNMEWNVFCSQIKQEIHMSNKAEVISGKLILTIDTQTVIYEINGEVLRRRVNFTGNEILLQHVSEATFTLHQNAVTISVKDLNGKEYSAQFFTFLHWETAA